MKYPSLAAAAASAAGALGDAVFALVQVMIIESAARQAGVDLATAKEAFEPIWEAHLSDHPSVGGMIDIIDEVVAAL